MRLIHAHLAELMIVVIEDGDPVRLLEDADFKVPKNIRHWLLLTLVVRVRKGPPGQRDFAALLDDLRGLGFQDRIGLIADQLVEVARAGGCARLVQHRARPRYRRLKSKGWVRPNAGKIRDG